MDRRSNNKNGVNPNTKVLKGVGRVSIKNKGTREINYGNCISDSRPVRITPGTLWIRRSNDRNGVYSTTNILLGVARVSIKNEGTRDINYGNCIAASRPDRITPGTLWIGRSNDRNGVYPTTQILPGVARVSIKNEGTRDINYGNWISASRPERITPGTLWIGRSNDKNGVYISSKY
jgi:multisubunit Na+/H+ antiporter MnhE subunit